MLTNHAISLVYLLGGLILVGTLGFTISPLAHLNARTTQRLNERHYLMWPLYGAPKTKRKENTAVTTRNPFQVSPKLVKKRLLEVEQRDKSGKQLTQSYCDAILGLCVASDEWDSVLKLLDLMKRRGLTQERSSYRACLQACFESGNGSSSKEILSAMENAGFDAQPIDIGLAAAAMCRNNISDRGWWRRALNLLKQHSRMDSSNTVTSHDHPIPIQAYDAVLECMVEERQWKEAVRFLRRMEIGSIKNSRRENGIFPAPEVSTYRAVIESCAVSNQAEQAIQILNSMKDRGIKPSTYSVELIISALSRKMQWRRSIQMLESMEELGVPKTVVTYNSVISACARAREVGMAKNLLNKMKKEGIRPDEVSFNSVIGACASTARWKDALTLLDQCYREPGVTPNIYIYTNAIKACAKGKNSKEALNLLQAAKDNRLPLDSYCYTAVIDACGKGGMWKKALSLVDEMQGNGIAPTAVTYSVAISACGNGGQWQKALNLLQSMREQNMKLNLITYNAAITALSKASRFNAKKSSHIKPGEIGSEDLWSRALLLLGQMKKDGIEPDGFCYSSAISCCGAEGRWEEALKLIEIMKKGGPRTRPNKVAYTAAISACGRAGEAEHALSLFQSMQNEGLSADRMAYNSLFSALRIAGEADKTYELWRQMIGHSTNKKASSTIATAKSSASPDIITLTDCIATLFRSNHLEDMDEVFQQAVDRGIILRGNRLDSDDETDLSGMSIPVASAAARYILHQMRASKPKDVHEIAFITGVGKFRRQNSDKVERTANKSSSREGNMSLRDYLQSMLRKEFDPPLESYIPLYAKGTVVIGKGALARWIEG